MNKIKVNLVKLLEQAAPQVWGGDERTLLTSFLAGVLSSQCNTNFEQIVEIDLDECVVGGLNRLDALDALVALANAARAQSKNVILCDIFQTERGERALIAIRKRLGLMISPIS